MIDKERIKHLAKLAKLKLSEEEVDKLTEDLKNILNYVEKINELELEEIEPLINLLEGLELREDQKANFNSSEIANQFPEKENNYLKVPKILEK